MGFGLSKTGSVTLTNDPGHPQPMVVAQVAVTGQSPKFYWKANARINVERKAVSGSNFTFRIRAQSSQPVGLQYWIFDTATQSAKDPTMAGLAGEITDEFGVRTFDATMAAMRIATEVETPKTPNNIPSGRFVSLANTQTISVPAGKVYAIAQATPSFVFTTYDTGGYSNSQTQPTTNIREDGDGDPGQFRWRQQNLQSYHSTGGYTGQNTIEVGLTRFEDFYLGWRPALDQPFIRVNGQPRHLIADVTNFASAAQVNPTTIAIAVNALTRTVSTGGAQTISQSVTPSATASASGGSGSYSYLWEFVSGAGEIVANGSAGTANFSTSTSNQPQGSTREAIWRCRVTDTNGVIGYGPDVTFSHVAQPYTVDVKLDPMDWADFNVITNADFGQSNHNGQNANGINHAVTMRAYLINYAGGVSDGYLFAYNWNNGSPIWLGQYRYGTGGNGSFTFNVNPGEHIYFSVSGATSSGRKTAAFDVHVYNETDANTFVDAFHVNVDVDQDNNYNNVDVDANQLNWGHVTYATNDPSIWNGPAGQVTGVNQAITLRVERYSFSGWMDNLAVHVYRDYGAGWVHIGSFDPRAGGYQYVDVAVNPNDSIHYAIQGSTNSGRQQVAMNMVVWNLSLSGQQIANHNVSVIVDDDNNYNVVGPPVVSLDTTYLAPGHQYFPSNRTITVQAGTVTGSVSGGAAPFSYLWERTVGTISWSASAPNSASTTISYNGRTNFYATAGYRLKVTDAQGRVAYSDEVYCEVSAGNVEA